MLGRQLDIFFINEGYTKVSSNVLELTVYYHMEDNYANVFHVIYYDGIELSEDQYCHVKEKIRDFFKNKDIHDVHILSLVVCRNMEKAKQFGRGNPFCWLIDSLNDRLIIYEDKVDDFYGMRNKIEKFLVQVSGNGLAEESPEGTISGKTAKGKKLKTGSQIPYVTAFFVLINILVFLMCTFTGDLLYNKGAFSARAFLADREYYRILTSVFLHWDMNHLVSNMIVLYYLGEVVEKHFGRIRFGIIYLSAGILGNLLSVWNEIYKNLNISSAGASGAVFGIIGAVFVLVCIHKGHLEQITIGRLLFMILYSLYSGFAGSNINNAAHIGGFIGGLVISFLLWMLRGKTGKNINNESSGQE